MGNMRRWTPMRPSVWDRDVFDEMERMFEEPFFGRRGDGQQNWGLPLDVSEREDSYVVRASIPGIDPDEIDLSISDNVLTIRGEMKHDSDQQNERYVLREDVYKRQALILLVAVVLHFAADCQHVV